MDIRWLPRQLPPALNPAVTSVAAGTHTRSDVDEMTKLGIVVGEKGNDLFFRDIDANLRNHYHIDRFRPGQLRVPIVQGAVNHWTLRRNLKGMLRRNDVCFFEWASELLMQASRIQMPRRAAIVTRLHSFELYQWAPKIDWTAVDRIILVSKAMQHMFNELYSSHAHKTVVVYNGTSFDLFRQVRDSEFRFNLGLLCNIKPIKRVYEVILMFHGLRAQGHDAHLHIAGEPSGDYRYAAAVEHLVRRLNLREHVTFHGYVTNPDQWLQQIDILILNSFWEGHPVALIEGMAAGCYCLSHAWWGADEALPADNLYVTDAELQQKIVRYSRMSNGERAHAQRLLRTIAKERFDILETTTRIRDIIDQAARR